MIVAAAALVLLAALLVLGVALYLLHAAHGIRRESDRTLARELAAHERERRDMSNRLMHLAGKTWEVPPSEGTATDPAFDDLFKDLDVNPEGAVTDLEDERVEAL